MKVKEIEKGIYEVETNIPKKQKNWSEYYYFNRRKKYINTVIKKLMKVIGCHSAYSYHVSKGNLIVNTNENFYD